MTTQNSQGHYEKATGSNGERLFDVAIVGGGASGLSAALTLSRALRRVVVIDSGNPRNQPASHMHGYLGFDGVPPRMLLEKGRAEIEGYGATFLEDTVRSVVTTGNVERNSFRLTLGNDVHILARRLLLASGSMDHLSNIPGLKEAWGQDVHVCPYCHGYEVRDQPLAVIVTGEHSVHYALMIRHWSADLIYFENDRIPPDDEQKVQFEALGIRRVAGPLRRLVSREGRLKAIEMEDGEVIDRSAVFLSSELVANTGLVKALGAEIQETGQGSAVVADPQGRTTVPGVWAAGNVTNPSIQVIGAAAAGNIAGASINMDLIQEDQALTVNAKRMAVDQADQDPS